MKFFIFSDRRFVRTARTCISPQTACSYVIRVISDVPRFAEHPFSPPGAFENPRCLICRERDHLPKISWNTDNVFSVHVHLTQYRVIHTTPLITWFSDAIFNTFYRTHDFRFVFRSAVQEWGRFLASFFEKLLTEAWCWAWKTWTRSYTLCLTIITC